MAAYGVVILITLAFLLFSVGTGVINRICNNIAAWDQSRVEEMKGSSELDVIRYAMILNRIKTGE